MRYGLVVWLLAAAGVYLVSGPAWAEAKWRFSGRKPGSGVTDPITNC